jgi:hypothetical protein
MEKKLIQRARNENTKAFHVHTSPRVGDHLFKNTTKPAIGQYTKNIFLGSIETHFGITLFAL